MYSRLGSAQSVEIMFVIKDLAEGGRVSNVTCFDVVNAFSHERRDGGLGV